MDGLVAKKMARHAVAQVFTKPQGIAGGSFNPHLCLSVNIHIDQYWKEWRRL